MNWKPISEAPKDGTPIKAYDPTRPYTKTRPIMCRWNGNYWRRLDRNGLIGMRVHATHYVDPDVPAGTVTVNQVSAEQMLQEAAALGARWNELHEDPTLTPGEIGVILRGEGHTISPYKGD